MNRNMEVEEMCGNQFSLSMLQKGDCCAMMKSNQLKNNQKKERKKDKKNNNLDLFIYGVFITMQDKHICSKNVSLIRAGVTH